MLRRETKTAVISFIIGCIVTVIFTGGGSVESSCSLSPVATPSRGEDHHQPPAGEDKSPVQPPSTPVEHQTNSDPKSYKYENVTSIGTEEQTRKFFSNTLAIMMLSPGRYHLAATVRRHYAKFFDNLIFVGPLKNPNVTELDIDGVHVKLYDIVYGNEQYRAVGAVIKEHINEKQKIYDGFLYLSDDLMLHPWALLSKNMSRPWAAHMGVANVKSVRQVWAVPGMSMQSKNRAMWPYWKKNRGKLQATLNEGGEELRERIYQATLTQHPRVFEWSKYPSTLHNPNDRKWSIFYTIVDTYFVPYSMALEYARLCDLFAKHWVFGECAIATMLAALHPWYEQLSIQFYWTSTNASDCPRYRWATWVDGFHRCRHDHQFTDVVFDGDDAARQRLTTDKRYRDWSLKLSYDRNENQPYKG